MKTTSLAVLSLLAGLFASGARAESRVYANIDIHSGAGAVSPVIPSPYYAHGYARVPAPRYDAPRGYWREVTVRNWVPDRWVVTPTRRGHPVRVFEPGHYIYSTDRVWVENRRGEFSDRRMDRWSR